MAERPPFPKKETEIFKISCESMAGMNAAAASSTKGNNIAAGRPLIMRSPPTSNLSSSTLLPFFSSQLISDHLQGSPSSILISNPNPNSIGRSPNTSTANASPRCGGASNSLTNPLQYHANHPNEMIGSCRFKNAEQNTIMARCFTSSIASSGLVERSPMNSAQPMKEHQVDDDLESAAIEDEMMIDQCGLLPAHAYSPWLMSWAEERYQEASGTPDMGNTRVRITYEEDRMAGSEQASALGVDQNRPFGSAPTSPPSRVDDQGAAPSSPSSSASELHNTSAAGDDISALTPRPDSDVAVHETTDEGVGASQAIAPLDSQPPLKKQRRKGQKRVREARVALLTKSEVEHLEDGYRWRKYGQKAVKNSPHPRSYYRCTNSKCSVKKRVERCTEDPSLVVTTYEGQHTHHSPALLRGSILPDPNYPISTAADHITFEPCQSSPVNPNLHFPCTLAHSQLIRNPFQSPANYVHHGFPQISTSLPFPSLVRHLPINGAVYVGRDNVEKLLIAQGAGAQGNVINSGHNDLMQAIDASDHHHCRRSQSFSHGRSPSVASTTVEAPHIDKGLLHDMLPDRPCVPNASQSPPT